MKKSIKILTLVLSLALICGAIFVAAFAADSGTTVTGVRVDVSADFEDPNKSVIDHVDDSGNVTTYNIDKDNGAAMWLCFKHQVGGVAKLLTNTADGNTYFTVDWTEGASSSSSGHFFDTYTANSRWGVYKSTETLPETWGIDTKYFVMDVDLLWTDPANYDGTGSFKPYMGYTKTDDSSFANIDGSIGLRFVDSGDQVAVKLQGDSDSYVIGSDGFWSHVTYIMGFDYVTDDSGTNVVLKQYLAIDGVLVDAYDWTNTVTSDTVINGDRTRLYTRDIRFDAFGKQTTSAWVDNYSYRTILPTYDGNLDTILAEGIGADLTAWESNLYNAENMPYGVTVAKNGDTEYDNLQKAVDDAAAGDTITLCSNVTSTVTVDKALTISCGDYTASNLKAGSRVVDTYDETAKAWTFTDPEGVYCMTYTSGNSTVGVTDATSFATVLANVSDGGYITLYQDIVYAPTATITVAKNVTLDLNGHLLDCLKDGTKLTGIFSVGTGKSFTILGEEDGSKLVYAARESDSSYAQGALFTSGGDHATVTIKGKGLFVSAPALYAKWADLSNITVNIEDCSFNSCDKTDYSASVFVSSSSGTKSAYTLNIKNAIVNGFSGGINCSNTTVESTVNVENSVILSQLLNSAYNPQTVFNVKSSYIVGDIGAKEINVLDGNCYFTTSSWLADATFADGVTFESATTSVTHTVTTHPWSGSGTTFDHSATLTFTESEVTKKYVCNSAEGELEYWFEYVSDGVTYSYFDLNRAISEAPAGSTITMLRDVSMVGSSAVATIEKEITVDLGGHHLQIIQDAAGAQIFVATTDTVTFKNGRLSSAYSAEYGKRTANYDAASPIFVAKTVAADLRLENVSTYTGGIFHNQVSGSKLTVDGGYHDNTTLYTSRGLVVTTAGITSVFNNASIYMDYVGALLHANSTETMSFTYNDCVVYMNDTSHRFIRVANDSTFVYFNDSDVYGAFATPTASSGNAFSSSNLVFGEGTTWGHKSIDGYTVVTPSVASGFAIEDIDSTKISYQKCAYTGKFWSSNFKAPETMTTGSITVTKQVVNNNCIEIISGDTVTYYESATDLPTAISAAASGATIKLLKDVTYNTTAEISISKALTFDLNGKTLTLGHSVKEQTFSVKTTGTVKFMNGNIATAPVEGTDYATANKTFAFLYVRTNNANIVIDNVNGTLSSLAWSWGNSYTITVNGGTYNMNYGAGDMNTSGFICGQANVTANVTGATIYANNGYVVGASSYRQLATNANGKSSSNTLDSFTTSIATSYTFTDCNLIATSASKSIVGNANEFVTIDFIGCYIYGSVVPTLNGSDKAIKYVIVSDKYVVTASACSCTTFTDEGGDSKCDSCDKYESSTIQTYSIGACPAENIVIGDGTYYTSDADISGATIGSYLVNKAVSVNKVLSSGTYTFDTTVNYVKVIWYDEDGNVLKTVNIDGSFNTLTGLAPTYEAEGGVTNGWYKIGGYVANGWTTVSGGTTAADLSSYDVSAITEDLSFYPQVNADEISAYLSAALYNLTIAGNICNNFYIPETPSNVEILGVYVGDREVQGNLILYRDYNNDPVYYTMYVIGSVGATEFTDVTEVSVKYRVNDEIELEQLYNLSPEKYANIIYKDSLKTSGNKYNTAAYNVTADLVRYSYLLSVYANRESTELTDLYNKMVGLCSELPTDNDLAGSTANASNLAGMGSIAFEASYYNPRWKFTLEESAKITDIKITLDGYNNSVYSDRTNFGTHTYGVTSVTKTDDGYITSAYTGYIPVFNIVETFTITFTIADGTEVSGTYDLKTYYTAVASETSVSDFLKSVFALANSTVAYKFPEGKVTVDDVSEFWDCDHASATATNTVVSGNYSFKPRYCFKCDSYLFYYEDYGAVADGVTTRTRSGVSGTNDYEAIYWTHRNANEWAQRADLNGGKHTAVVGNSNPSTDKYYYISLPEGRGLYQIDSDGDGTAETVYKNGQNLGSVTIATDTAWNGVNFIIDDNAICNNYSAHYDSADTNQPTEDCTCGRTHNYTDQQIFVVDEYGTENYTEDLLGKMSTSLAPGATSIGYAPGRKMLVSIVDNTRKIWYRYGSNASNGVNSQEVILVDEFGNIDPTTPVQWTYDTITSAKGYAADTAEIKISGLDSDGNINSSYESYVNNDVAQYLYHYESCSRNITIQRSNATVEGIYRYFTEEAADNTNNTNDRMAYTFIVVQWCNNPTVKDMSVVNHNRHDGDTGVNQGSYEFSGSDANAISWINCDTRNLFSESTAGETQAYPIYRGLFGTNRLRNMYLSDCYLNSFDAHSGAHNVTIENSTFEHMNFVGGGQITINNVIIYTTKDYGSVVNLRTDYGSIWKGDLAIDGLEVRYSSDSSYKPDRITLLYGSYVNKYYGFDDGVYMPQNVTINNFHIQAYTATVSGGVRTETLGTKDASSMSVYYYYGTDTLTEDDVATTTAAGSLPTESSTDNGTSVLHLTQNLTITNSVTFTLPSGYYWQTMNVTIDGSKYTATEEEKFELSSLGYVYYLEWSAQ